MARDWRDHWSLLERYFARIHAARFGDGPPESNWSPEQRLVAQDDMLSYLVHAHHLKDWLARGDHKAAPLAAQHPALRLCADVANATKHVWLKNPRVGQVGDRTSAVHLILGKSGYVVGTDLQLIIDGRPHSMYALAGEVRKAWISVLHELQLDVEALEFPVPNIRYLKPVPEPDQGHPAASGN